MSALFDNPLKGLTARQLQERLRVKFHIEAEAMNPTEDSFYVDMKIEYKNMDRLQFAFYEQQLLDMWSNMNKTQVAVHVPEICGTEPPCPSEN